MLFMSLPSMVFGGEFIIGEYRRYGSENYLELLNAKQGGAGFEHIMSLIEPSNNIFNIRILSPLTDEAKNEITNFFEINFKKELLIALKSKGNLNNPAILPLEKEFISAFKTTTLYEKYKALISSKGYEVVDVTFEKFEIQKGEPFVVEIWLKCKKKHNL